MTVSMRKVSPGTGYRYLLRSVVAGDGNRSMTTPLARYYAEVGSPPGRWMGGGLATLGAGELSPGAQVQESQLALLIGLGRDPINGEQLGRAFPNYGGGGAHNTRVHARVAEIAPDVPAEERDALTARIEAEELAVGNRRAVAGFDFTFSVPKSVSVLWGISDADVQTVIVDAHHAAVHEVVEFLEREVAATRAGVSNADGAVAQVDVAGVIAAAFDHWDSRSGDPQLHTHVVISNKVKTLMDGRWRSLDSRPMHAAVVALSAHYNAVLADRLAGALGIGWEQRARGDERNPQWEIAGIGDDLIAEFSGRTRQVEDEKERLIAAYVERHGRQPSRSTIVKLRAQATLATRPDKQIRSLADLSNEWRVRARAHLGRDAAPWARGLVPGRAPTFVDIDEVTPEALSQMADRVIDEVSAQRSTWRHWNLWAGASKHTMGWRFRSAQEREAVVAMVVEAAEARSLVLTPPELAPSPAAFCRADGTSVFRPKHSSVYSSSEAMAAEDRLLRLADDRSGPVIPAAVLRAGKLTRRQFVAVAAVATSRRRLDVLVGPAGAGKTTAMRTLRDNWIAHRGRGSVVGLAPSAAAAKVLGDDLGVRCENTAKWLHDHDRGRVRFRRGQLVIVDEATLADTRTLDRLVGVAADAGAKVLLVGDPAQLQSVDAGGAFSMLAHARADVPELIDLHRFVHEWEKEATLDLRVGRAEAVAAYARNDRLREGTTEEMLDAAYSAWKADAAAGVESILVTESRQAVEELNTRARADRLLNTDNRAGSEVGLSDGARASAGDVVITRRNDRRLRARDGGWVRNGDRWVVTHVDSDGSVTVSRIGQRSSAAIVLPSDYVAAHVELGYAVTAHRAQGVTVDTAHVVASSRTTRENLYVSMTRGRSSNTAYVALDEPDDSHSPPEADQASAQTVLFGVLQHSGVELSAHQTIRTEQHAWSSIAQLAAEYETLAAVAQRDRWLTLLACSGLTPVQVDSVVQSPSFGPLCAVLRRAEAVGRDPSIRLRKAVERRRLDDAEDVGAVLHRRLQLSTSEAGGSAHGFIAGLIPAARGQMPVEYESALAERERMIEARAGVLAHESLQRRESWVRRLGSPPDDPDGRTRWMREVIVVAAYRDRYGIDGPGVLGPPARSVAQRDDARMARSASRRAVVAARSAYATAGLGGDPVTGEGIHGRRPGTGIRGAGD